MTITVRRAAPSDLGWLVGQLEEFSRFFGTKRSLYPDYAHAEQVMKVHMEKHLLLVADKEGTGPVGFIAGLISPHIYNPEINVLTETFWWVSPEHRGSRAGLMLLNEFVSIGKEVADWVHFSLEHHSPVNESCLTRRGFKLQERAYLLEVS